jgi:hypothetical protein
MTPLLALIAGAGVGVGVLLLAAALAGRPVLPTVAVSAGRRSGPPGRLMARVALAMAAALAVYGWTGWPAGSVLAALGVGVLPRMLGARARHQAEIDRVEAIASWAEQLRDTMAAANGLEQAIGATAAVSPAPIAGPVGRLAARLDHLRLSEALRAFADEVDHPTCDFVVAGLVTAAERQARDVGPLLSQLAECARDEAQMRARVWSGRARTRTSVRVISSCVVLFALGLLVFQRTYLEPYDSAAGQAMLLVIGGIFAGSVVAMERMGRIELADRFLRRRVVTES